MVRPREQCNVIDALQGAPPSVREECSLFAKLATSDVATAPFVALECAESADVLQEIFACNEVDLAPLVPTDAIVCCDLELFRAKLCSRLLLAPMS